MNIRDMQKRSIKTKLIINLMSPILKRNFCHYMVKWLKLLMLIAKTKCGEELADVAIYLLGLAEILSIDLDGEIQKNENQPSPPLYQLWQWVCKTNR